MTPAQDPKQDKKIINQQMQNVNHEKLIGFEGFRPNGYHN